MKAVIMAGGEGSRLRPLTCDTPKPMTRLCGRPVLAYILDLLARHGFDEAAVTLRYLPDAVTNWLEEGVWHTKNREVKLHFIEEDRPLGTAGGVKHAADWYDDSFLVISGDALTDFDLSAAMKFHKEKRAAATLLVKQVKDPREYGLVNYDEENRITGFLEKPGWSQASTNTANTGIYILDPSVLTLIPEGKSYDFGKQLFPLMLQKGLPLFAFPCDGYWCDIGDLDTYLSCQQDILMGKVSCTLPRQEEDGIYCSGNMPEGNYQLVPPVYIGESVTIGSGAVVGPGSVLDDRCSVGKGASVKSSVMLPGSYAGDRSSLCGALLGPAASVKRAGSMFEASAAGAGSVVGERATVMPGVRIWPGKQVEDGLVLRENLKFGSLHIELFDDEGIAGETGVEVTPEFCARLGAAIGSLVPSGRVAVSYSADQGSKCLCQALTSGILSTGAGVLDFGMGFEAELRYLTGFYEAQLGIFLSGGLKTRIAVLEKNGLPLTRALERDLESKMQRGEFKRCSWENIQSASVLQGGQITYQKELMSQAPEGLSGLSAGIKSACRQAGEVLKQTLKQLGCGQGGLQFHIGNSGRTAAVFGEEVGYVWPEKVLALCCLDAFEQGMDVALPSDAPRVINYLAQRYDRQVLRYLDCPVEGCDQEARELAGKQPWVRDGLMMTVRLLNLMKRRGCSLAELLKELPSFAVSSRSVVCRGNPGEVMRSLSEAERGHRLSSEEGILLPVGDGQVLVRPSSRGKSLRLQAEAESYETANELCGGLERLLFLHMKQRKERE